MTNINVLPVSESIPASVIQYLDPTIESLYFEHEGQKNTIHLKFHGKKEILLSDPADLNRYLSSGTVKGIVTFTMAIQTLKDGGYLIVDELEDHFNKEIAATLMRFFMDRSVNTQGGVLIFSTHYPEILDEFNRNDSIFITRNRDGIQYQIQTLLTTNGQTPFVSVFMYLGEVEPGQTRDDLALIISETLNQRYPKLMDYYMLFENVVVPYGRHLKIVDGHIKD